MKKPFTLIIASLALLFSLIISNNLQAQIIKGEAIMGLNLTQVDGDEIYGYTKPGFHAGIGGMIPFNNFDFSMELLFNQRGASQRAQYSVDSLTGQYNLRLNYVEIPVLLYYTDKDLASVGAGFSYSRLIGAKEFEHGLQTPTNANNGVYNKNDFCIVLDIRLKVYQNLKFNFRYQYSMAKIRTREYSYVWGSTETWTRNQYNNSLTFRLVYIFNEERSKENQKLRQMGL